MAKLFKDDTTVKLFDLRKLSCLKTFYGHRGKIIYFSKAINDLVGWVKNLELISGEPTKSFLSASFDGTIRYWDLNKDYPPGGEHDDQNVVLSNKYIARMRLTPDASKMIVSLHSGQLVLIKNLELSKKNELEVNLANVSDYISTCLTAALKANPETGSKILIPGECLRKTNQIELLLEVNQLHC
jgi:WD40 repeat protein